MTGDLRQPIAEGKTMQRRRFGRVLSTVAAFTVAAALTVGATAAATKATVSAADNPSLGAVIVGATGMTLYHYAGDYGHVIKCTGSCATLWPPVVIAAMTKPVAGSGAVASKLGTLTRPDGTMQVTYNGYALYRFSGDKHAGQANGQGLEKQWYAINPSGALVKTTASTTGPGSSSSSGSGSSSSSGSGTSGSGDGGYYNY
jgi:predicted lipoprotein with Yx(FWY)xxD motif